MTGELTELTGVPSSGKTQVESTPPKNSKLRGHSLSVVSAVPQSGGSWGTPLQLHCAVD